jgi:hypothetical protein
MGSYGIPRLCEEKVTVLTGTESLLRLPETGHTFQLPTDTHWTARQRC